MSAAPDLLAGLDFQQAVRNVRKGMVLKSLVQNYLHDVPSLRWPEMPERDFGDRPPDGWFHPSTHPLWPERALFDYLANPARIASEPPDYMRTLSLAFGVAMHGFMAYILESAGLRPPELQRCEICRPEAECNEPGVQDEEAGERGHMDGILALPGYYGEDIFEFKTANNRNLSRVPDLDLDAFRAKWPDYYAQQQSYLRMSGRRRSVVLIMSLGYPWDMREIHVPFDPAFADDTREKYMRVRQAVADQRAPGCGCLRAQRNGCPSRGLCAA